MKLNNKWLLTALLSTAACGLYAQQIPLDTAIHTGKLPNGLTYYIRHNEEPKKRVVMYLVNKVGSILEDNDQQGLAHFMEHMNFNGTKHYPKNELEDYLQKAGVRFGADLNAYTSYDETVFELPIPLDDPSMLNKGLGIIRDWAQDALLDSTDIAQERGVVLEEERLGLGAGERMRRQYMPILLNNSRYAVRTPIGLHSILTTFKPEQIRRFHSDWYRPDLQAVIVVGDINVKQVEAYIKAHFSDEKNPKNERVRTHYSIPLTGENRFVVVTDKEQPQTELNLIIKHKAGNIKTEADYLAAIKRGLFGQMLGARYGEQSLKPDKTYLSASAGISGLLGGLDAFSFSVVPKQGQLEAAVKQGWTIVKQVEKYGFTQDELDRAKKNYLSGMEASLKEASKVSSQNYVKALQSLFLHGEAQPSIQWEYDFVKSHLDAITTQEVNSVASEYIKDNNRDILLIAPDSAKANLPDSATVTGWFSSIENGNIAPYKEIATAANAMLLKTLPTPGKVVKEDSIPKLGITEMTLSNGVKVLLKPTTYQNDAISFMGFAPGGTSLSTLSNYVSAGNATSMLSNMGLGNYDPIQLSRLLTGKIASAGTFISDRTEGAQGSSNQKDLETALQLLYLKFTQPRMDTAIYRNIITSAKQSLAHKYSNPANIFRDTVSYFLSNYNERSRPFTVDRIDELNLDTAYNFYKERFADASAFTFVFVGNFNVDSIRPLLETYLGSLPATHANAAAKDLGIRPPEGRLTKIVRAGTEDKASVEILLTGKYQYSAVNNLLLYTAGEVLELKLLRDIREKEAEVYSPSVKTNEAKEPEQRYSLAVSFGCAPKNVDHLVAMVEQEIDSMKNNISDEDVQKVKLAYQKQMEQAMETNGFWLSYIVGKEQVHENLNDIFDRQKNLDAVTPETVRNWVKEHLTGKNFISLELLPQEDVK
ncbi:hypothetical protein A9P82_10085 [Arachidicoccus ginsenosidimutans]|uniref:M16 family metallopeptidase n=1 Tax=Arachidicoccus sp. BS20 TaxID=1850526 RepID=UPI0007F079FE|nr:M16 family metallopeptidase [Arachidicoccus sp. BS20]ANI90725.1 hypothetical protein A9P82_10085 [Arachidicoccus sp. BS20]